MVNASSMLIDLLYQVVIPCAAVVIILLVVVFILASALCIKKSGRTWHISTIHTITLEPVHMQHTFIICIIVAEEH